MNETADQETAPAKSKLPKEIRVEQRRKGGRLLIDGEEFPWHISDDGISTTLRKGEPPTITITLIAETVLIEDSLDP